MQEQQRIAVWPSKVARLALALLSVFALSARADAYQDAVVLLPLDEGSGTVANDASGMGNDGTLVNGAVFEANTGDGSPFAVRFDGLDDRIDIGSVDVNGSGLTLAAWFNPVSFPGPSNDPRLISKASGVAANDHVFMLSTIEVGSEVRLRARVRVGGSTTTLVASSGNLATGTWQHAAATYDGSALRLYLDGQSVGGRSLSGAVDIAPSVAVSVGGQPSGAGSRFWDGLLDDVRILQRALSGPEIEDIVAGTEAPASEFSGSPTSGTAPLSVSFSDLSSGDVTSWSWDFGDGNTSTAQNPSNNYTLPGTYTVALTATGPGGNDTETKTDYVTVNAAAPAAEFSGSPTSG
ncbi:MAG: PKD domain-containing protein, partial [bacterium]|nr:PKD domain-containing protein [bacterium]